MKFVAKSQILYPKIFLPTFFYLPTQDDKIRIRIDDVRTYKMIANQNYEY